MTSAIRSLAAAAGLLALLAVARPSRADSSLHTTLTTTTGVSTNVNGISDDDPGRDVNAGAFLQLAPGVVFTQQTRRIVHVASYVFQASLFAGDSGANSYSNRLSYQSVMAISPRMEMSFGASATNGRVNALAIATPADQEQELLPQGDVTFVSLTLQEGFRRRTTRSRSVVQDLSVRTFAPIGGDGDLRANHVVRGTLGMVQRWQRDALQLGAVGVYDVAGGGTAGDGTMLRSFSAVRTGPEVRWIRDLGERLSADAGLGVLVVVEVGNPGSSLVLPTGSATLRYERLRGRAQLTYSHRVESNLFIGESTVDDIVSLSGGIPLPWAERLSLAGTVSYNRGRILDLRDEVIEGRIQQVVFDTAVAWRPLRALTLGARVQAIHQSRDAALPGTLEAYMRTQVMLSMTAHYPSTQAGTIPSRDLARADDTDDIGSDDRAPADGMR